MINKEVFIGINRNLLLSLLLIIILFITSLTNYTCRSKTRVHVLVFKLKEFFLFLGVTITNFSSIHITTVLEHDVCFDRGALF